MKYKIISTDFDGTLLSSDKKVSENVKKILLEYKKLGYIIVGITARNLPSVKSVCDITLFDYVILNNGAYIYDVKNEDGKYVGLIDRVSAKSILDYFTSIAKAIDICCVEKYYRYKSEITKPRSFTYRIDNFDDVKDPICRINIFGKNDDEIRSFKKHIDSNFYTVNTVLMVDTDDKNSERWITLNPKNLNKFSTLKLLCSNLGVGVEKVVFFGDGLNDIEIIKGVGLGVSMGNALQEVKDSAKITIDTNDNDGIAKFLERNFTTL